ncbi:MAG: M36 family metallopeptidase [bacterium]|nr:M36 family metallopeptidase [bacterium]
MSGKLVQALCCRLLRGKIQGRGSRLRGRRERLRIAGHTLRELRLEQYESRCLLAADLGLTGMEFHSSTVPAETWDKHESDHDHEHLHASELQYRSLPWSEHYVSHGGFLTQKDSRAPLDIARDFVWGHMQARDVWDESLQDFALTDLYRSEHNGVTHAYFQQRYQGLPIANTAANVNVTSSGQVLNAGISFVPDDCRPDSTADQLTSSQLKGSNQFSGGAGKSSFELVALPTLILADQRTSISDESPVFGAEQALVHLADEFGWQMDATPQVISRELGPANRGQKQVVSAVGVSEVDIPAELQYVAKPYGIELSWRLIVQRPGGSSWFDAHVSASTGEVLSLVDWVNHASYNVFAFPKESPLDGGRTLQVDPHDALASPFAWHDTNGLAGAETTTTRGNNVWAYADRDGNNAPDFGSSPDGGPSLTFNFNFDPSSAPLSYRDASVTNLFYWSNILHDFHYQYGFNEAAGNFQENNYGRGGVGSDSLLAEAQDQADGGPSGAQRNNANFATPPDGFNPRMQMFLFNYTTPDRDSSMDAGIVIHEYAHGVTTRLTGGPSNAGSLNTWQSAGMGEGWSDWHTLMLTQVASDTPNTARGVGTYSLGQSSSGPGIRSQRYTHNIAVNNLTFGDIVGQAPFVHFIGEVWAATLWDLNWALIEGSSLDPKYVNPGLGFDADLYNGTGGNNLALQLVMDGLKLQPANPTFLEARDAILAADVALTGGANQRLIWEVFARRGMGFSATDGGDSNSLDVVEAFDVPSGPNGVIAFDSASFDEGSLISATLRDSDLTTAQSLQVSTSRGDVETFVFNTTAAIGFLTAAMDSSAGAIAVGDGVLQVADGDVLTISYVDADDGQGGSNVNKSTTAVVVTRMARAVDSIGPEGGLMGLSSNVATLRSGIDVEPFTFFAEAGELVGVTARPFAEATLNLEIVGLPGTGQSPAAGAIADLVAVEIPVTGQYQLLVSGDVEVIADVTISRNTTVEAKLIDSQDGNELPLDDTRISLAGGNRYAASAVSIPSGPGIVNGGFETGDFSGWEVLAAGNVLWPWTVSPAGDGTQNRVGGNQNFGLAPTQPQEGNFAAWNGFDGAGPMEYILTQDVYLPNQPVSLTWEHRIQWNYAFAGGVATEPRVFEVQVRDPETADVLRTLYSYQTPREFEQATGDTGWVSTTVDLAGFDGQLIELAFIQSIPQVFTGPGQFEIDNVQLLNLPAAAPDIDEFEVDLSGKTGQSIDVVLTSGVAAMGGAVLELLDTDGTTVLATGTSTLAAPASITNYRQGILDFEIPGDGVYTLRVTSNSFAEYQVLVTESLVYDTEPNDSPGSPLRSLDGVAGAIGFVDGESLYTVGETDYDFVDISSGSIPLFLGDDVVSAAQNIGFNFDFYGQTYSQFYVSSNGFLTFLPGQDDGCCIAPPLPDPASPNAVVAGFWRDLIPELDSFVRYKTEGVAGQRVLYVEFHEYAHFSDRSLRVTMQFKLFEDSGAIEVHYTKAQSDERVFVVAIENHLGNEALEYYRGTESLPNDFAIRYQPASAVDRYTLTLEAGQEVTLRTRTPLSEAGHSSPNSLNPELSLLGPSGALVAADQNTLDGKNAELVFEAPQSGVYTVVVSATNGAGGYLLEWFDNNADTQGPRVMDVILGSSAWSSAFVDLVDGGGEAAGNGLGLSLVGSDQLRNVSWINIDKLFIQFDEDVSSSFTSDNVSVAGLNLSNYAGQMSLAYGVDGPNIGTITFSSPLSSDILSLNLSENMKDASGNLLDGEWSNASSLVSGNGTNGGAFQFQIDVLAGDVNNSNAVSVTDVFATLNQSGNLTTELLTRFDVNGNGAVNLTDVYAVLGRSGTVLP